MQPFRKLISARIYLLTLIEAVLATGCYIAAAFLYYPVEAHTYLMYDEGAQHIGLLMLAFLVISYLFDSSTQVQATSQLVLFLQVAYIVGILLITQAAFAFLNRDLVAPQGIIVTGSVLTLVILTIWRLYLRPAAWGAIGAQRILFVGAGAAVDRLARVFDEQPSLGMDVRGYVVEPDATAAAVQPVLGGYRDLVRVVSDVNPDRVIVSADNLQDKRVLKTLFDMRSAGVTVESAADTYEAIFGRIYSRAIEPYTVIFRNELSARPGSVALQSIYNNLLALVSVTLMLPVMAVIAIALKLTRRGAVLVKHTCIGLHGQRFNRYRFRCDRKNLLSRILIKYKLEALPQILNIFRGEMALIGPRAERAEFSYIMDDLIPFYRQRYSVKPGVMGWSQLHCDTIPAEDTLARIEYDLYYIKHISLVLDAYILLRALKWILSEKEPAGGLTGAR